MIKILIKADSRYPINRRQIRQTIKDTLKNKGITVPCLIGVVVVGDRKMKALNKQYREKEETTDVLSFSLNESQVEFPEEDILNLGEIIISFPQARKQAGQYNILVDKEILELVEHGLLHLLGYHHD